MAQGTAVAMAQGTAVAMAQAILSIHMFARPSVAVSGIDSIVYALVARARVGGT